MVVKILWNWLGIQKFIGWVNCGLFELELMSNTVRIESSEFMCGGLNENWG